MHKHPLSAKERLNLVLNVMFTQGLQVLGLGLLMFVILVVFGVIAIDPSVLADLGRPAARADRVFGLRSRWSPGRYSRSPPWSARSPPCSSPCRR